MLDFLIAIWNRILLWLLTLVATTLVTLNSLILRVRMSHENGITLRGKLRIVTDPDFPQHDLFEPGREFGCRIRHGCASFRDDAKCVVRSGSVKFADTRYKAPLDILMNSGRGVLFNSARTLFEFMMASGKGKGKHYVPYLKKYPFAQVGGGDGVRRNPKSYALMEYHSKCTTGFIGVDGVFRYVRFSLRPDAWTGTDSGYPDTFDYEHPWLQNPYADETRTRNYLKDEIAERVKREGSIKYSLLMQLRDKPEGPDPEWISSHIDWDESAHPRMPLAHIEMVEAMDYTEAMKTWFNLGQHPKSLPIPGAVSIDDPNSLNHLRLWSLPARWARLGMYMILGMLKKFPDTRDDKTWQGIPPVKVPPGVGATSTS